ncbi:MAG: restriction endonuclease subunit S [Oscillospiraceae bacterium]|nr:restriction endonuclease subunit S [Oscillospiraceae bacterium]
MKVKIGDICTLKSGTSLKEDVLNTSEGIPYIKVSDMNLLGNEKYIVSANLYANKDINTKMIFPKGTVLFPKRGGAIGTNKKRIANTEICADLNTMGVIPSQKIRPLYLFYYFQNIDFGELCNGSSVPQINNTDIAPMEIELVSLEKQDRIIANLDKLQSIITHRKQQLEKLDELVKARFVEMFGEPIENPKVWKTELMNDIAPAVNYNGEFDDEVWLLNLDMVETQTGRILDYLYVDKNEVGNSTCTFDTSNVLYSKLRPYLNKVVIPDRCGYATSELVPLQPVVSKINREYLAFMLRSASFVKMINEKVAGAKMPRVSMGDFRKFAVPVPPIDLQNQFATFVEQINKSKVAVQKALDEAQLLFDSLMQEYFG